MSFFQQKNEKTIDRTFPDNYTEVILIHRPYFEELCFGDNCMGCDKGYDCKDEKLAALINLCHDEEGEQRQTLLKAVKALKQFVGTPIKTNGDHPVERAIKEILTYPDNSYPTKWYMILWNRASDMRGAKRNGVTGDTIRATITAFSPEDESSSPPKPEQTKTASPKPYHSSRTIEESFAPYRDGMEVYGHFESEAARRRFGCPGFVEGIEVDKDGKRVDKEV